MKYLLIALLSISSFIGAFYDDHTLENYWIKYSDNADALAIQFKMPINFDYMPTNIHFGGEYILLINKERNKVESYWVTGYQNSQHINIDYIMINYSPMIYADAIQAFPNQNIQPEEYGFSQKWNCCYMDL